jgi:predicted N-acetyltransferase YhbS
VHPDARRQGHGSRLLNAGADLLREAGADTVSLWLLAHDETTREFAAASGFAPDGAYRDRVVSPDGQTLREVRLSASLLDSEPGGPGDLEPA